MSDVLDKYGREIKVGCVAYFEQTKNLTTVVYVYGYNQNKGRFLYVDLKYPSMGTVDKDRAKFMFIVTNDFSFEPVLDNPDVFGILRDTVVEKDQTLIMGQHSSWDWNGQIQPTPKGA